MKVILYARVSTTDQMCENQKMVLMDWINKSGIEDYDYVSEEMSSRKTRPLKQEVLLQARQGKIDVIVVTRLDRWARSLQELVMDIHELVNRGVRFVAIENGMDFSKNSFNSTNQLMLNILASFAEFERSMISERTREGMARAKAEGKHCGRPRKKRSYAGH